MEFITTFILFTFVEFLGVWWAKSIEKSKALQTGLSAAGIELLIISSMWIALVGESIYGAAGCVVGAGFGAYIGLNIFQARK